MSADEDDYDSDTLYPPTAKGNGKKNKTTPKKIKTPTPPSPEPSWEQMFFQLVLYRARNGGSCNAPKRVPVEIVGITKIVNLGNFVSDMRRYKRYLANQANVTGPNTVSASSVAEAVAILTPDRIEALDSLGFTWRDSVEGGQFKHSAWEEYYDELKQHHGEHGNCEPNHNKRLKNWCYRQRCDNNEASGVTAHIGSSARRMQGKAEEMAPRRKRELELKQSEKYREVWEKRKAKLDELGFVWSKRQRESWEDRFESLKVYKAEHGHCNIPHNTGPLGKWCNMNKTAYKHYLDGTKTSMTEERIALLESLGFKWLQKKRHPRKTNQSSEEEVSDDDDCEMM